MFFYRCGDCEVHQRALGFSFALGRSTRGDEDEAVKRLTISFGFWFWVVSLELWSQS